MVQLERSGFDVISISSRNERRTLKKAGLDLALAEAGQEIGDCFDVSTLRREDFIFHTGKDEQSDIYQAAPGPSTRSPRGHQGPAAFLMMASGLRDHGSHAELQLRCLSDLFPYK